MCRYVAQQISEIDPQDVALSHAEGNLTVLVIAPKQFASRIYEHLKAEGIKNLEYRVGVRIDIEILDGYQRLIRNERSRLGWRLVVDAVQPAGWEVAVRRALLEGIRAVAQ